MSIEIIGALGTVIAFFVTVLSGFFFIPYLKKLKFGQTIKEIGPVWHKSKQGTPLMGGLMFILATVIAYFVVFFLGGFNDIQFFSLKLQYVKIWGGLLMSLALAFMGFMDDYVKVVKKRNLGLTARQKLLIQILIAVAYLLMLYIAGERNTTFYIPFAGYVELGYFYYPLAIFLIVGFSNAVNLTDGVDGLASSVTFVYALSFMVICSIMGFSSFSTVSAILCGACLGFLVWNFHPAKVFMGDTGSMFLGGMVLSLAFGINMPVLLVFAGFIYLMETMSVILQVISVKTRGKRIFKMSPIHHHFEMSGWSEVKIVYVFSFITFLGGLLSILFVKLL